MLKLFILTFLIHTSFAVAAPQTLFDFNVKSIDDKPVSLSEYKGKVIVIVNTASGCGYTPQYEGLEALYEKLEASGLVLLGFPSNDFGGQEPGSNAEIKKFCKLKYKVKFPIFSKDSVSGDKIQPLFKWLTEDANSALKGSIKWNFEKFLIDKNGHLVNRFKSSVAPDNSEFLEAINQALTK